MESPAGGRGFAAQGGLTLSASANHAPRGSETTVAVRTAYIELAPGAPNGSGNAVAGTIHRRMFHGDFVQYVIDCPLGQMIVRRPPTNLVAEGEGVSLSFSPEHCILLEE